MWALLLMAQSAQASAIPAAQATPVAEPPSEDIIVSGLRDIDGAQSVVRARTLGSSRTGAAAASRADYSLARYFAACAVKRAPERLTWLRRAIDSRSNSKAQQFAVLRLQQMHPTCVWPGRSGAFAYYQRGALVTEALKAFAPTLALTTAQTSDPVVQARFNRRETPLAAFRLAADRRYFETAICFVRLQPSLSTLLVRTDRYEDMRRIEAAIVNRTRGCVGNAQRVYFDATQFRFYIADAVYRWAVAAAGTDTLIPSG